MKRLILALIFAVVPIICIADTIHVPGDQRGRMTGEGLRARIGELGDGEREGLFAVVASAGVTNTGIVDDLARAFEGPSRSG